MSTQTLSRIVLHPPDRVFAAFTDVDSYPRVVRLVRSAELLARAPSTIPDTDPVRFAIKVGYGLISTRFVARGLVNASNHVVVLAQESGPFESFKSRLELAAVDAARTRVTLWSDWILPTSGIGGLISGLLEGRAESLQKKLVAAFVRHLDATHGTNRA